MIRKRGRLLIIHYSQNHWLEIIMQCPPRFYWRQRLYPALNRSNPHA